MEKLKTYSDLLVEMDRELSKFNIPFDAIVIINDYRMKFYHLGLDFMMNEVKKLSK